MSDPVLEAMQREGWDTEERDRDEYPRDPRYPAGESLYELKTKAETKRIDIANAVSMKLLISRKLSRAMLDAVGQQIRSSFVDLPRRVSGHMANMAGKPGIEMEFEKYLADYVQTGIENVKIKVQEMCETGFFDDTLDEV